MRTLRFILQKEFRQMRRDPAIWRILFLMPVIQLLILPLAADYEIKNINLAITDHDHSQYSQLLIRKITASGYFRLTDYSSAFRQAQRAIERDKADLVLEIPAQFDRNLVHNSETTVFIAVNAINGVKAGLGAAYLQSILQDYNKELRAKWISPSPVPPSPTIDVQYSDWFNPHMNYQFFMVPGILVMLLTMIGSSFASNNIVRETELGTIEQINVSPIRKTHFIFGKLIPFWLLSMVILTLGLIIARLVYGIIPLGHYFTIYVFASAYLLSVLGLGLLMSTYAKTQQQSMLVSFFITMIFNLMSGLYTPVESMPPWGQWISRFTPVSYFIQVIRMVVLKGSGLKDILPQTLAVLGFAIFFNTWAIINYKKRGA